MASTPPPYVPMGPKKSNNAWLIAIILGAFGLCCLGGIAMIGFGGYMGFKYAKPVVECSVNLQLARDAVLAYAREHGGKLPKAAAWEDASRPYLGELPQDAKEATQMLRIQPITKESAWGCSQPNGPQTGIAFNEALSGKALAEIADDETPLLFEVDRAGRNLHGPYKDRPKGSGPKIGNDRRDWAVAPVRGEIRIGGAKMDFSTEAKGK